MNQLKRGDTREDGMVFFGYVQEKEYWTDPEVLNNFRKSQRSYAHKRLTSKVGHAKSLITKRKIVARQKNIPFQIAIEELLQELPENCPVLGIPLSWGERKGHPTDTSPSLDRFDSKKGYVSGNVFWISQLANRIKNTANIDQINAVAAWMNKIELTKQEC